MIEILGWVTLTLQWLLLFFLVYLIWPLLPALLKRTPPPGRPAVHPPPRRLAVVTSAHNEASVIGPLVESLVRQRYSRERFDVFVIANNCTDATAARARAAGARVHERETGGRGTKGAAITWWWAELGAARVTYDAIVVLDADNLAPPEFLAAVDAEFNHWPQVAAVQARRLAKNPDGSQASRLDAISEILSQMVAQAGRRAVGLSGFVIGSGTAYQRAVFDELASSYTGALNEDAEWQLRMALAGQRLRWTPDAWFFDEKTAKFDQIERQRARWLRGKLELIRGYAGRLLVAACTRGDLVCLDQFLFIVQPPRSLLLLALVGLGLLSTLVTLFVPMLAGLMLPPAIWAGALGLFVLYVLGGLVLADAPRGLYLALLSSPLFIVRLVAAAARALTSPARRDWTPTQRAAGVTIDMVGPGDGTGRAGS